MVHQSRGFIEAGWSIEAGESIEAGGFIFSFTFDIKAKWLTSHLLPFYRKYWAETPPLRKYRNQILDGSFCWDKLRQLPTEEEKKRIVAWEGWHWILKGQLECFLGLIDKFYPPKDEEERS